MLHGGLGQRQWSGRQGWFPFLRKGDWRVSSNYRRITRLSLLGKVYSSLKRLCPIVEPRIQEVAWFLPRSWSSGPKYYPHRVTEGVIGVWPSSLHVFWGLGNGLRPCSQRDSVGVLREYEVPQSLLQAIQSQYNQTKSCVLVLGTSRTCLQFLLDSARAAPCHQSCLWFSWIGSRGVVGKRRVSGLETLGSHLCILLMMWFCWLLQAKTSSAHWSSLRLSVKRLGWESALANPRPRFSTGKKWNALSRLRGESLPQAEEFK